ncbi:hypothetical protein B9Z65_3696 [Elsinoe australis]|uniref:Isochorismatase-like domain-containing protein n=1 Tax=Elsinoe australis TaxID=40998 RepID=A0A2P8AFY9_9PEZI|nr:hypothetical protein B9Z65_3696 [Elsinoe australis]
MAKVQTEYLTEINQGDGSRQEVAVGSGDNTWIWTADGWDLTRSLRRGSDAPKKGVHLDCELVDIRFDPVKTALIIIDMQNIGLNKALDPPSAPPMYAAQGAILNQIIWLNWGLTEDDLANMPPSEARMFAFDLNTDKVDYGLGDPRGDTDDPANFLRHGERPNFSRLPGTGLGEVLLEDGSRVQGGRVMMRDTWNTALHGPLAAAFEKGKLAPRPDVLIYKNCSSGIRTLLFAGVNTDQCVGFTLQDANAQSFDTIILKDGCGTDSPPHAKATYEFNCVRAWGFLTSCKALAKAAGLEY